MTIGQIMPWSSERIGTKDLPAVFRVAEPMRCQVRQLLDIWMVFGGIHLVETTFGRENLSHVVPLWWVGKRSLMLWIRSAEGKGDEPPRHLVSGIPAFR